jgi:multicomponent K+:H+ antiporter subunit G
MTFDHASVPLWAAIAGSAFLLMGALLTLLGTVGLIRLPTFYERIHAPTLGTSWGTGGMALGSMIIFTAASARPVLHEILIALFVTVTTPVTLMMLARAAFYRDRSELNPGIAPKGSPRHPPLPSDRPGQDRDTVPPKP